MFKWIAEQGTEKFPQTLKLGENQTETATANCIKISSKSVTYCTSDETMFNGIYTQE